MKTRIILLYSLILVQCGHKPGGGMTGSISESKKLEVFIAEYTTPSNPYKINDTLQLNIKSVWVERKFRYDENNNFYYNTGYQLIIECEEKNLKGYSFNWTIGNSYERNFRSCGNGCLISDFDVSVKDIETWEVQKGMLRLDKKPEIIGKFKLIKKSDKAN